MDINGAKALKRRLERNGAQKAPATAPPGCISAHAPPVYHWTGVNKPSPEAQPVDADGVASGRDSLFRRLGLSLR